MAILSGQITVTTAGTAVQGPDTEAGEYLIRPSPANTGSYAYVGNDGNGDVSSTTGMILASGDAIVIRVTSLTEVWFDVATNGDKICWFLMESNQL